MALKLYRAPLAGRAVAVGQWEYCGAAVVTEERRGQPVTGNGDGEGSWCRGCCCGALADDGGRKMEMASAAQCGRVLGALRRALAWLGRTGQGAGDARPAVGSTRRAKPAGGRPLNRPFSSFSDAMQCLTTCFDGELSAKPKLQSANDLHDLCSPMYQLQLWLRNHAQIRN